MITHRTSLFYHFLLKVLDFLLLSFMTVIEESLGFGLFLLDKRNLNLMINLDQMCRLNDNDTVEL